MSALRCLEGIPNPETVAAKVCGAFEKDPIRDQL
jgi:hypothetical protein